MGVTEYIKPKGGERMTEHVSATLVDPDTLLVEGVPFDRRSAQPTPAQMDGTRMGRRLESLYHGEVQRMELCQRIVHLEGLVALLWQVADERRDGGAWRRARSESRALGLG